MAPLLWISDFFLEDGFSGGAEEVDNIYIEHLSKTTTITKANSHTVSSADIDEHETIVVSNFTNMSDEIINKISDHKNYFIMEHDHKYLLTRDPSPFRNHQAPPRYVTNKVLYKNSKAVFCQSSGHANSVKSNLFISNVINLSTSMWTQKQFDHLSSLHKSKKKTSKHAVLSSENIVKNTRLATNYCKSKEISYDLISDDDWYSFVSKLSEYKGLVFFPRVYESHCRLVVEARMLNLEVVTNNNIGATSEEWFASLKGQKLIDYLRSASTRALKVVQEALEGKYQAPDDEKPLVSIITSMYKGEAHVKSFLDNIVNQTYFENCELILLNANSPENEYPIIEPYLKKHSNIHYEKLSDDPGLYGTWNIALQKSKGKYITNANLDDRRANNQIEELVKALEYNPDKSLAYTECYVTQKDGEDFYNNTSGNSVYPSSEFSPESMIKCLPGCMPVWKREMHEHHGVFNEKFKMAGDWEMWLRAVQGGCTFMRVDEPLGLYYYNPTGLSTDQDEAKSKERYEEEKAIFWKYTDVFGQSKTAQYKEYFSR